MSVSDDELGRAAFARMVSSQIASSPLGRPSTVFGIVGPWGAGKSSMLNMVRELMPANDWVVVDFSPWSALDAHSLTREFLNTLASAFKAEGQSGKRLRAAVLDYSHVALPLLGLLGTPGAAVGSAVGEAVNLAQSKSEPWQDAYSRLAIAIEQKKQKVLIVADDIDRLDSDELMAMLRAIRLLGRFRNIHYLLAYDQETIDSILSRDPQQGRGRAFMEKIVQYPFELPPMASAARRKMISAIVESMIAKSTDPPSSAGDLTDAGERASELISVLFRDLDTPRSISRFREQLESYASLLPLAELDPLDFTAVTYLRVFHHSVWSALMGWRNDLFRDDDVMAATNGDAIDWDVRVSELAAKGRETTAISVIGFLFDLVSDKLPDFFGKHERAFSDARYFERYLISAVPDDDVSDLFVEAALSDLLKGTKARSASDLAELIDHGDLDKVMLALDKCLAVRARVPRTSLSMINFARDRRKNYPVEAIPPYVVDHPRALLSKWAGREMLVALETEVLTAEQAIAMFGENDVLDFARQHAKGPTGYRMQQQASKLVDHLLTQLHTDLPQLVKIRPKLRSLVKLAALGSRQEEISHILDNAVKDDLALFEECVTSFARVTTIVTGARRDYMLDFYTEEYLLAFGPETRSHFANKLRIRAALPPTADLLDRPPTELEMREHALRTARELALLHG